MLGNVIWVTGARGFIGSHLVRHFAGRGHHVIGFGRQQANVQGCYAFLAGGIEPQILDQAVSSYGCPDRIYHLAGGSTVGHSIAEPLDDFESNVLSTAHLFDAIRRHALDAPIVIASSAAVYGAGHDLPIALDADIRPYSPYGHHKYMAENIARYYAELFLTRCTVFRLFSIYGPGIEKQLLFDLCTRLSGDTPQIILGGTGSEVRDWCFINDLVAAMVGVEDPPSGHVQTFNLGSGTGTCIREVANSILGYWGEGGEVVFSGVAREGDPFSLVADKSSLPPGFVPTIDIETGLSRFVDWFKQRPPTRGLP